MSKSKKITLICVATVVAIGLIIAGLFFIIKSDNKKDTTSGNSSVVASTVSEETESGSETTETSKPTATQSKTETTASKTESNVSSKPRTSTNVKEEVKKESVNKDDTSITVDDIETAPGKKITVPVMLNKNPGIAASVFEIQYNVDKLEYVGYKEGEVFENYYFKELDESLAFSNIENGDTTKTGVMFYLEFKVKDDAVLGDTEIKLNVTDESFMNFNEEFIKVSGGNAIVSIK